MEKEIKTNVFGITVYLNEPDAEGVSSGRIVSDLRDESDEPDVEYLSAIGGLESLILAHACAGVDITAPAYLEGIEVAIEAIANNF